jgi:Flp pilus assembly CpaF family ATPase
MLRTALGPAIATFLEDPSIVEVTLNPDGRLWIDRLSGGWRTAGASWPQPMASGSFVWSPTMSVRRSPEWAIYIVFGLFEG